MTSLFFESDLAAAIFVPVIGLTIYGVIGLFMKRPRTDDSKVNWTPFEAIGITAALYFLVQVIAGVAIGTILGGIYQDRDKVEALLTTSTIVQFGFVLAVEAITAAIIFWFVRWRETPLRLIGLVRPRLRDIGYVILGFVAYFVIYVGIVSVISALSPGMNWDQKQELGFDTHTTGVALGLVFVSLVILPPLVEELLCRGFLFSGLRTKLKFIPAAIITSLLFAAAHLQFETGNALLWIAALDTFLLSMVLVYLREKTGSLWPGIGLHAVKNGIAFVSLFVLHSV